MEKISKAKINRYVVMRLLYVSDKFYSDLREMGSMRDRELLTAIGYCLNQGLLKKEIAMIEVEPTDDIRFAADLLGIEPKDEKKKVRYHLTRKGIKKLAYLDCKYEIYKYASLPSFIDQDEKYFEAINEIAERKNYFSKTG